MEQIVLTPIVVAESNTARNCEVINNFIKDNWPAITIGWKRSGKTSISSQYIAFHNVVNGQNAVFSINPNGIMVNHWPLSTDEECKIVLSFLNDVRTYAEHPENILDIRYISRMKRKEVREVPGVNYSIDG
jgi:hypothetical protein